MDVYHYTIAVKIPRIYQSGGLNVSTGFVTPPEKPAVWFSTNDQWEPSAAKMNGVTMKAFDLEQHVRLLGMCRFKTNEKLLPTLREFSRIDHLAEMGFTPETATPLALAGIMMDGNPVDWWFSLYKVPLDKLTFEVPVPKSITELGTLYYEQTNPTEFYHKWARSAGTVLTGKMSKPGELNLEQGTIH